jgi:hypothetical protein
VVASGFAILYTDEISTGFYNLYSVFYVPELANGIYRLQIYDTTDDSNVLASNFILARNDDMVEHQTALCRYRNDRYFYHTRYSSVPGFYSCVRLNLSVMDRQNETDKEQYTEVTTGKQRTYNNFLRRYYKFETYYFDAAAHEAAAVMVEHDYVEINGLRFRHKTPYKEVSDPRSMITKGEFEMYDENFGTVNRCTITPDLCLGDGETSYIGDGLGNLIRVR